MTEAEKALACLEIQHRALSSVKVLIVDNPREYANDRLFSLCDSIFRDAREKIMTIIRGEVISVSNDL